MACTTSQDASYASSLRFRDATLWHVLWTFPRGTLAAEAVVARAPHSPVAHMVLQKQGFQLLEMEVRSGSITAQGPLARRGLLAGKRATSQLEIWAVWTCLATGLPAPLPVGFEVQQVSHSSIFVVRSPGFHETLKSVRHAEIDPPSRQ